MSAPKPPFIDDTPWWRSTLIWGGAFAFVLLVHGAGAVGLYSYRVDPLEATKGEPAALMLEFSLEATAPVLENESDTLQQETEVEEQEDVAEEKIEQPEEVVETPPSDMVEEVKKPEPKKPEPKKPEPKKPEKKPEPKKPDVKKAAVKQQASAPNIDAKAGDRFTGPKTNLQAGRGGTADPGWRDRVQRRVNNAARQISRQVSGHGLAVVKFSYDGSGRVLSARIVTSSGSTRGDDMAIKIANRSSPLPAPPNGASGEIILRVNF